MKKIALLLITFLGTISAFSQNLIEGKVADFADHLQIPYVSITSKDGKTGSASNTDGHFVIAVETFPVTLIFSHVNYGKTEFTFPAPSSDAQIELKALTIELPEVNISASNPLTIVGNVFDKLTKSSVKIIANGFYRQWTRNDDIYSELIESFYMSRIGALGIEQTMVTQGRYAKRDSKENGLMINKNFSIFTNTFPMAMIKDRSFLSPIHEDPEKYFTFRLSEKIKSKNGKVIYVISFTPLATNTTPGFSGKLFIDDEYNLFRFKGAISDPKFNPINSEQPDRVSNVKLEIDAFCDNNVSNIILLENLKADLTYTYRYDDKNSRQIHTSSFYFVYELDTNNVDRELAVSKSSSDYASIFDPKYDETFWDRKQILSQTPVEKEIIKQFRKSKQFKKVFQQ